MIKEELHSKGGAGINWKFCLCRQSEIKKFFDVIKPMNSKHVDKFNMSEIAKAYTLCFSSKKARDFRACSKTRPTL